ncbi:MAG: amidohydrolase family protein [Luteitalea sp.]|nr:amidohydrolase family protein [Luteitalea sp.]
MVQWLAMRWRLQEIDCLPEPRPAGGPGRASRHQPFMLSRTVRSTLAYVLLAGALAASMACQARGESDDAREFDLIVQGGRVYDGHSDAMKPADVAIAGDRIAAVGDLGTASASLVIDARGKLVTPGFIDVHSHAGESLTRAPLNQAQALIAQGVTTIVINPDGGGPVDLASQRAELEAASPGVNVIPLIGHGAVRSAVLGMSDRAPTAQELERMQGLVRQAMEEGAFGLSSGLFYAPGSYATTDEVIALMRVVAEHGGVHSSHIRDEDSYSVGLVSAVAEIIQIAEGTGTTGIVSHMKALGPESWGKAAACIEQIAAARERGVRLFADQYPYEASSTSLMGALVPRWAQAGGREALLNRLRAPDTRARLLVEVRENIQRRGGPSSLVIAAFAPDHGLEGQTLEEIAREQKASAEETALNLVEQGNASVVSFNMSMDDIDQIMRQPWTMTSSDGGLTLPGVGKPHPRNNGAFPRKLALFVREKKTVTLEAALRSMTALPAEVFGLSDRGVLRKGAAADVLVFDPTAVRDRATYEDPHQLADGMSAVIVNGVVALERGEVTGAVAGKVLRATAARNESE